MQSTATISSDLAADEAFPPALRTAGRVLAAVVGVAAGAAVLVFGGLFALLTTCDGYGGDASTCGDLTRLVGPLEIVAVLGGATAAVAGGIATAKTSRARWIATGLTVTIVLVWLLTLLLDLQRSALS